MKIFSASRLQLIQGLRALADFYERNPAAYYDGMHLTINMYVWGDDAAGAFEGTARAFGSWTQRIDDRHVTIAHDFSDQVTLAIFASRAKLCSISDHLRGCETNR